VKNEPFFVFVFLMVVLFAFAGALATWLAPLLEVVSKVLAS
jgi:hypothetical protein